MSKSLVSCGMMLSPVLSRLAKATMRWVQRLVSTSSGRKVAGCLRYRVQRVTKHVMTNAGITGIVCHTGCLGYLNFLYLAIHLAGN